jgi:hypothetical protein
VEFPGLTLSSTEVGGGPWAWVPSSPEKREKHKKPCLGEQLLPGGEGVTAGPGWTVVQYSLSFFPTTATHWGRHFCSRTHQQMM